MAVETARVVGFRNMSPEPAPQDCPSYRGVEAIASLPLHFEAALRKEKRVVVARADHKKGEAVCVGHAHSSLHSYEDWPCCFLDCW